MSEAWNEGGEAANAGDPESENPYQRDTSAWREWRMGWHGLGPDDLCRDLV